MSDNFEIADRFFAAVEHGDVDTVREIYHPGVVIWHNIDGLAQRESGQSRDESLGMLAIMPTLVKGIRYDILCRDEIESGFVQQHVLRGTLPNGDDFAMPVCLTCRMEDGKITRIDEYLDSVFAGQLMQAFADTQAD